MIRVGNAPCSWGNVEWEDKSGSSLTSSRMLDELTQAGYKVFFSRITLEDKLGREYEPYIFAALNSAKVMVVIGTKQEMFTLTVGVQSLRALFSVDWGVLSAGAVLSMLPLVLVFIFLQRYFIAGSIAGALKE